MKSGTRINTQLARLELLVEKNSESKCAKIIAVSSGKGGVGKTAFTVNLGLSLANLGKKVLMLDADLGLANLHVLLGLIPNFNLQHVIKGEKELEEIILQKGSNLQIIPGGSGIKDLANLQEGQIQLFLDKLSQLDEEYDFFLIDTGAGLSESILNFIYPSDEVIIVTTPEPTSLTDAYGLIKTLVIQNYRGNFNIVINKAMSKREGSFTAQKLSKVVEKFLNNCSIHILGVVLYDKIVSESIKKQKPFIDFYPNHNLSRTIYNIAEQIISGKETRKSEKGVQHFFAKLISFFK